jgi:glycosyltransferase involved in cell wall biosynthesis
VRALSKISILIPTRDRPDSLAITLASLDRADPPPAEVEIAVLDNGSAGLRDVSSRHPLRLLRSSPAGKNRALNLGIAETSGELVAFLDDDVTVASDYLVELAQGVQRWPTASGYGGRIELEWPSTTALPPEVIRYAGSYAYASHIHTESEGFYDAGSPTGPNMAFWRKDLPTPQAFDPDTGPAEGAYRMGGGETLFRVIRERGGRMVHLPRVVVKHRLRAEQLTEDWLMRRSFSYGRSLGYFGHGFRDLSGRASLPALAAKWSVRVARQLAMFVKGKDAPRMWARIDRRLIEGILYERLFVR